MLISFLSSYIRNIATFLVLATFIGIILPSNKYKKYISLIIGFILIFVMIEPFSVFSKTGSYNIDDLILKMSLDVDKSLIEREGRYYTEEKNKMVHQLYTEALTNQVLLMVEKQGIYHVNHIDLQIDNTTDTSTLEGMSLDVTPKIQTKEKKAFIRIDPVKIDPTAKEGLTPGPEDEEAKNLKNFLSDFYNLSEEHIHIKVTKEEG